MKFQKSPIALALLALGMLTAPMAQAQDSGWYGGASVGRSMAKIDDARITNELLGVGLTATSISDRDRDTGYKLYGGYQVNRYLAVEAGFFDLGKFGFTATTAPPGTLTGDIRLQGLNLDVVASLPLSDSFSVFGRVGANYARARDNFSGTGLVNVINPNPSKRDTNLKAGLGLQYDLNDSWSARLEAERYRVNDAVGNKGHVDLLSLGLVYRFGPKSRPVAPRAVAYQPPPVVAAPAPAVVAAPPAQPMPAAAPMPYVAPAPVRLAKVSFSADSLFDFDRSEIKPAGKQALDKFAADLRGLNYDVVKVTGHTDRIGSHDYNMRLSTRRAEAVSAYLVQSAAVPSNKISSQGVDGANPVTRPEDCKGSKPTPALIACLQPDRRVEVEVTGTR